MIEGERGIMKMAGPDGGTKLQADYDQAIEDIATVKATLECAYTPEASRADLVAAVGEALTALEEYESEEQEDESPADDED